MGGGPAHPDTLWRRTGAAWLAASWVAALLAGSAAPLAGCGGGGAADSQLAREQAERRHQREQIEKAIDKIRGGIASDPLQVEMHTASARRLSRQAAGYGFGDLAQRAEQLVAEAESAFASGAQRALEQAIANALQLAAQGDPGAARQRLRMPDAVLAKPEFAARLAEAERRIALYERARQVYDRVVYPKIYDFEVNQQYQRLRGLLEGFLLIEPFAASPPAEEVKAKLAEIEPKAEEQRAQRAAEAAGEWLPAFYGEEKNLNRWEISDWSAARVTDGVCVFRHPGGNEKWVSMMFGEEDWRDYIVEARLKLVGGDGVYWNFRGALEGEGDVKTRNWRAGKFIGPGDAPPGTWVKVRFEVRGPALYTTIWTPDGIERDGRELKAERGPFEIRLGQGGELHLQSVFVMVLGKAQAGAAGASGSPQRASGSGE